MALSKSKQLEIKLKTVETVLGYFYKTMLQAVPNKIQDIDSCVVDFLDGRENEPDEEEELRFNSEIQALVKDALGTFNIRVRETAAQELLHRNKHREGVTPTYMEEDL